MNIDSKLEVKKIIHFIQDVCIKTKKKKVVIACSGGIDSSLSLSLLCRSVNSKNIHVLFLPYASANPDSLERGQEIATHLEIPKENIITINIQPMVDIFKEELNFSEEKDKLRLGNVMARVRMVVLYDFAKQYDALVCGTENKSEYCLGYFTRFGDEASDFEPIQHLYKTQVYSLAKYLNIPKNIIDQEPSAGLWENQTDEKELGFSYEEADQVFYRYFDQKLSEKDIVKAGFKNAHKIISYVQKNAYKHTVPYVL